MCYFHVKQACKARLRGKSLIEQKVVLDDIDRLHSSVSQLEYDEIYTELTARWRVQYPDFDDYFREQWHHTVFDQWKVFNSAPGVSTTNNAIEGFNSSLKRIYTNHARHTLPALVEILLDRLLPDLAVSITSGEKTFALKRKPDVRTYERATKVTSDRYETCYESYLTLRNVLQNMFCNMFYAL